MIYLVAVNEQTLISYTAISIKVVTETIVKVDNMGAKRMVGIITDLNKSSRLSATLYSVVFNLKLYNIMYCLINEQECFIRFKVTSAQREWL